jgi:hypothetical protein
MILRMIVHPRAKICHSQAQPSLFYSLCILLLRLLLLLVSRVLHLAVGEEISFGGGGFVVSDLRFALRRFSLRLLSFLFFSLSLGLFLFLSLLLFLLLSLLSSLDLS